MTELKPGGLVMGSRRQRPKNRAHSQGRLLGCGRRDGETGKGGREGMEVRTHNLQPRTVVGGMRGEGRNGVGGYRGRKGTCQHRDRAAEEEVVV